MRSRILQPQKASTESVRRRKSKMPLLEQQICFRDREFKGSRLRCLLLTSKSRETVRSFLRDLIAPHGDVDADAKWLPEGFLGGQEVNLEKEWNHEFLRTDQREELAAWWLRNRGGTTPT